MILLRYRQSPSITGSPHAVRGGVHPGSPTGGSTGWAMTVTDAASDQITAAAKTVTDVEKCLLITTPPARPMRA